MPNTEKQLTACQMLKNEVESRMNASAFANEFNAYKNIYNYINNELLATERQQLIDFYNKSTENAMYNIDMHGEELYNNTFKPNK